MICIELWCRMFVDRAAVGELTPQWPGDDVTTS